MWRDNKTMQKLIMVFVEKYIHWRFKLLKCISKITDYLAVEKFGMAIVNIFKLFIILYFVFLVKIIALLLFVDVKEELRLFNQNNQKFLFPSS